MSKVKFGLRGFEFGEVTAENKVLTTMKIPGIKSAKIDITNELITVAADDGPYVVLSSGITGTQLEVSVLDLPTEARKVLYGIEVKNGIEVYNKNLTPKDVACIFRTSTEDGKAIWIGLLKGNFREWRQKRKMVLQILNQILLQVTLWLVEIMKAETFWLLVEKIIQNFNLKNLRRWSSQSSKRWRTISKWTATVKVISLDFKSKLIVLY